MNEIRRDQGYQDETPSEESQRAMRRIMAGQPPNDPEADWNLSDETRDVGRAGVADARKNLTEKQHSRINKEGLEDARAVLDAKRRLANGEALSPQDERILAALHRVEQELE